MDIFKNTQLKYRRIHFKDYARELAPRPASVLTKISLPSFFKSLFLEGINLSVKSVSGKKYSFWHALLNAIYPDYITLSWYQRKLLVDRLIDELSHDVESNRALKNARLNPADVKFQSLMPTDTLIYYLCCLFQINIVICDNVKYYLYFPTTTIDRNLPAIMMYCDDNPIFHCISADDCYILGNNIMNGIYDTAPERNKMLDGLFEKEMKPELEKLHVPELKILAEKYGIKTSGKKKSILISEIISATKPTW